MLAHRRRPVRDIRIGPALLALAYVGLAGCLSRPGAEAPAPTASRADEPEAQAPAGSELYVLDGARSELLVLVRRAGPLARFGHDHVLRATAIEGRVWQTADAAGRGFSLEVPVAGLAVDEAAAREAAGEGFEAPVPEDARAGTRANLLRAEVLDAARHPTVRVESRQITGPPQRPTVRAAVTIRGATVVLDVPVLVTRSADGLEVEGRVGFRQSDVGIVPFSIAGGAVQVADPVEVRFRLVARRR